MIPKNRKCKWCGNDIPKTRRSNATYCCDEHYYEAKKARTNSNNHDLKKRRDTEKRYENILGQFYWTINTVKKDVFMEDLERAGFNFGFSTAERQHGKEIYKVIGSYAYTILTNKKVKICPLN
jgi:hypothetical protein